MAVTKKELATLDNWPTTTDRYVAFIDIMGFKDMVAKLDHGEIYGIMKSIEKSKQHQEDLWAKNKSLVRSTTYSDSVMLYSRDNTLDAFDSLITIVSGMINDLFELGIPHKGAIAFGKMTLDLERSIFFGQPLIDAYLLQEELHFYGIIIHNTVEGNLKDEINRVAFIEKYECPLKKAKSSHYTVYPMHSDSSSAKEYPHRHKKLQLSLKEMRYRTSGQLRSYIDNTEAFLVHMAKK
jgi:hypothetical protein